jgi:DNA-binding transcriptional ArsR family regulator
MSGGVLSDLPAEIRDRLVELPRTAALVYLELRAAPGERTVRQLSRETGLPQRSVRRALRHLDDAGLADSTPRHDDPPTPEWRVSE